MIPDQELVDSRPRHAGVAVCGEQFGMIGGTSAPAGKVGDSTYERTVKGYTVLVAVVLIAHLLAALGYFGSH